MSSNFDGRADCDRKEGAQKEGEDGRIREAFDPGPGHRENKNDILQLANDKRFGHVEWVAEKVSWKKCWKERRMKTVIDELGEGDRLIVPELSRMGRSMLEIMEMLSVARQKGIYIYSVKGG